MVDTRTKGSGAKAALEQYFEEIEEGQREPPDDDENLLELEDALREVAWLRKEVGDLRTQLAIMRGSTEEVTKEASRSWLKVTAAAATALALGTIFSRRHYRARGGHAHLG
ncbi:hypothetical protein [Rhizobium sp. BK661]|uniref:hypothetical protein n=1 Tax=Rhizobium sp. BK661 TaxID=2586991 RepID=UPI00216A4340|nr:hypothetical protein [Rhizobium sp. BK661]MCS3742198.1 hypothetical protein [Rhizobium sp. BK661]